MNQCSECLHHNVVDGRPNVGECRRYPPIVRFAGDLQLSSMFPLVKARDCCGEYVRTSAASTKEDPPPKASVRKALPTGRVVPD